MKRIIVVCIAVAVLGSMANSSTTTNKKILHLKHDGEVYVFDREEYAMLQCQYVLDEKTCNELEVYYAEMESTPEQ
ncbi:MULTISPECIES: hypothetical protein [Vibrio]|uniref:hypothetical protein n=1 Tax=Vibrio TaxID=662 RepID=UPI00018F1FA2|nr:hypothetical protein [Vibrio sp. 16]EED28308.1 hypothetical protein VPMS16_888 [Vibrio sp. 16]CAK4074319.1 hypothetical protein VDT1_3344 [Vibrio sp. 16]